MKNKKAKKEKTEGAKETKGAAVEKKEQSIGKAVLRWVIDLLVIIAGSLCYAVGVHCFTAPNSIAPGGVAGIATIVNVATGMEIGLVYGLINIPLIIIGFIFLGKKTMIKTVVSVSVISIATDYIFNNLNLPVYENGDKMLASIFGGVLFGAGLGLVYLREGTSGGTDIINKLINKKMPHFSLGAITLATDAVVITLSMVVYESVESGMYAIVAIFICTKVMDMILYGSFEGKMLLIFSDNSEEIASYIMMSMDRGVTFLKGEGAYSKKDKNVICCAVHKNEYAKIKRKVKELDPKAFIIITNAGEVLGDGFHENS